MVAQHGSAPPRVSLSLELYPSSPKLPELAALHALDRASQMMQRVLKGAHLAAHCRELELRCLVLGARPLLFRE